MQVQTMQGYFDDGAFYQKGRRIELPERQMVIVNVLDIPVDNAETLKADVEFWKKFDILAKSSFDEELQLADFPRTHFGRELVVFNDEES
jgi:hypothetical protein